MGDILLAVKEEVRKFHAQHRNIFADAPPMLRAISPLAEGSDRLFAEQALALDFALCCPLPFPRAEFEEDFAPEKALEPDSVAHFRTLLDKADTIFELDGRRQDEGAAYGACGRVVLDQSDLLIVIWDGQRLGKRGGTEETLVEARHKGVPVVWIDAQTPHSWQLLDASTALQSTSPDSRATPIPGDSIQKLARTVQDALALPKQPEEDEASETTRESDQPPGRVALEDFYGEQKPRFNPAVLWKCFKDLIGDGRCRFIRFTVTDFEKAVEQEWPRDESTTIARIVNQLRPFYAWPDKLAVFYSDAYRSAFILAYLLAATAVGLALLPLAAAWFGQHHGGVTACVVAELFTILTILALVLRGRRRRWHERWIDYRLTAELVRHLRLMVPLGGGRAFPQLPAHLANYGHPGATWMAWYVRAVERALGLPSANFTKTYLLQCLAHVHDLIKDQLNFHQTNAARCHRIEKRLHTLGMILLGLTLLACAVHLLPSHVMSVTLPHGLPGILTFLCGFLPALGAALAGINNQGEFRRIAKRSKAMAVQLDLLLKHAKKLESRFDGFPQDGSGQDSTDITALATQAAQLMINEVLDWRVVFLDRPLYPPT